MIKRRRNPERGESEEVIMTFTIYRVRVFVQNANAWYDDTDFYNSTSGVDDINNVFVVFGHKAAWNLYRKEVQRIRKDYEEFSWSVTIESALVPEGGLISGRKLGFYPGDGFEVLKELKWEPLDATKNNMSRD